MALPPSPNQERPRHDASPLADPEGQAFVAAWLAHVEAGRIGSPCRPTASLLEASLRPTASLLEAGGAQCSDETRAIVLANERLICGRQRTMIG